MNGVMMMNGSDYFLVRLGLGFFSLSSRFFLCISFLRASCLNRSCPRALESKMSLAFSLGLASMTELSGNWVLSCSGTGFTGFLGGIV